MIWVIKFIGWIVMGNAVRLGNVWVGLIGFILIEIIYEYFKDREHGW